MKEKAILRNISLDELTLDTNNPRFSELYSGSDDESELIDYLLFNESAYKIANSVLENGEFYPDRPLWVIKKDSKYLVKDGNRRCAAIKALQHPSRYGLDKKKMEFTSLPTLVYKKEKDVDKRMLDEHTNNLFKPWERIAKALAVYDLYKSGESISSLISIDSSPSQLIKLASFYYAAKKINGDEIKKLFRKGKGETGGKATVFERLFRYSEQCGYRFKRSPNFKIHIKDNTKFSNYISAMIEYLIKNPEMGSRYLDSLSKKNINFLNELKDFGFDVNEKRDSKRTNTKNTNKSKKSTNNNSKDSSKNQRKSGKTKADDTLFGKDLILKKGKVNNLYLTIIDIYNINRNDETILLIVGMSLRLIVEVAARIHYIENNPNAADIDQIYNKFLKKIKKEMKATKNKQNFISFTKSWLDDAHNLEGILHKYPHDNILISKSDILASSIIVGDILEFYFKR